MHLLLLLIAIIAALLAIGIFFAARRRKDEPEEGPPPSEEMGEGKFKIDLRRNHLFLGENMHETFQTFNSIIDKGRPGLCLTNRFPDHLRTDFGLKDARIVWFSEAGKGEDIFKPQRLDFEITRATIDFIKKNKEPVILLDGLEYLILSNGFEKVSKFLKRITDVASMEHATLVVIVRPDALTSEKVSYLKGQFDRVV